MKELIEDLMYEYDIRKEMVEEVADLKSQIASQEYNISEEGVNEVRRCLECLKKAYTNLNKDEEYVFENLENRIKDLEGEIETEKDWKESGENYYTFYGISERDFY